VWLQERRQRFAKIVQRVDRLADRFGLHVLVALVGALVVVQLREGRSYSEVSDLASIVIPLITLGALLTWHKELLTEQASMRRLQTRPQVLVYFARKRNPETDREMLMLVIEHFGGGPALDVQFTFSPPLVNHEGKTFADEPPFSTGIAVMRPEFQREIEFDDYYQFQNRAGLTRIVGSLGVPVDKVRLDYDATVTLRDPIGDDQKYETRYKLDLRDLMPYTMDFRPSEDGATEAAPFPIC
jgi:hypothetical protein